MFLSASSLRFVPDIIALKHEIQALGDVHLATTICGNELVYYGIHALSMFGSLTNAFGLLFARLTDAKGLRYYGIFGGGAVSCLNVGKPGRNIVRVRFENGRDLVLMVAEAEYMRAGYQINIYGTKGWRSLMPNLTDLYYYLISCFFDSRLSKKQKLWSVSYTCL